jgi:hypothetical protein
MSLAKMPGLGLTYLELCVKIPFRGLGDGYKFPSPQQCNVTGF